MKVNYQKNNISYKGFYNSKILKKALEFAADNGTLFAATATLTLSGIRPLAILATPNTDKKNKRIACAKSLTSTTCGYLIALFSSLPLSNAMKKIDDNPNEFLKENTIRVLKNGKDNLNKSKAYLMATQLFKLGLGLVISAPKSILTALGTPYILKLINTNIDNKEKINEQKNIVFKGKNNLSNKIGKILDKKWLQNFVIRNKESNFPLHIVATTDSISTATFVYKTSKDKNFEKNEKKTLINNSIISTVLSISSTYIIDWLTKDKTDKFIENYKKYNKNDPNLLKQINGIKIAKPIIIAGLIYYIIIPSISTYFAERLGKKINPL